MSFAHPEYDSLIDAWKCEICLRWYQGLGYHIRNYHGVTVREYNKKFGFDLKRTYLAKDLRKKRRMYTAQYRDLLRHNFIKGIPSRFKKGEKSARLFYQRSVQTKNRLKMLRERKIDKKKKFHRKYIIKPKTYEEQASL